MSCLASWRGTTATRARGVRDAVEATMARDDGGGDDDDGDGDVDECELDAVIARAFTSSDASTTEEATARLDAYKVRR